MKRIQDLDVRQKKVLVRCDFNVPLSEDFVVLDDFRIRKTLPTIEYLISQKAKIILMSHLGRPEGKIVEELRLTPIAAKLSQLLDRDVRKLNDCVGKEVEETVKNMQEGEVILLENVQFNPGEKAKDPDFAKTLASYANIFILEAFGQAHRDYASISGIQKYLPSAAGFLLKKEIEILSALMEKPEKPLLVIVGGAKVETKSVLIDRFSKTADFILINGLIQREIKEKNLSFENYKKIIGPVDEIEGKDIGPQSVLLFEDKILDANTIFWNGPLGKIEEEEFAGGTDCIARFIADATDRAFTVIGGGETVEFVSKLGLIDKYSHVSTGGGAMLEFLSGKKLPGIIALD